MTSGGARASPGQRDRPAGTDTFPVALVTGTVRRPRRARDVLEVNPWHWRGLGRMERSGPEEWKRRKEKRNPPERKKGKPSIDKSFQMNLLPPNCLAPTPPVLPGNRGVLMPFQRED